MPLAKSQVQEATERHGGGQTWSAKAVLCHFRLYKSFLDYILYQTTLRTHVVKTRRKYMHEFTGAEPCMHTCQPAYLHGRMSVYVHMCTSVYMYIHICVYTYMCMCVCRTASHNLSLEVS